MASRRRMWTRRPSAPQRWAPFEALGFPLLVFPLVSLWFSWVPSWEPKGCIEIGSLWFPFEAPNGAILFSQKLASRLGLTPKCIPYTCILGVPFPFFPGILLSKTPPQTREKNQLVLEKNDCLKEGGINPWMYRFPVALPAMNMRGSLYKEIGPNQGGRAFPVTLLQ